MKKILLILGLLGSSLAWGQSWNLTGNSGTNPETHFIGTTDKKDLVFKTHNSERLRIDSNGRIQFGPTNANIYMGYSDAVSVFRNQDNIAIGNYTMQSNTHGTYNIALGSKSLSLNTTGHGNVAVGFHSLKKNTSGSRNTAYGHYSLPSNTTGSYNVAIGSLTLYFNATGDYNTAQGNYSLYSNTTGSYNTAQGNHSLYSNTTGGSNIALGYYSLRYNTTGNGNIAIGYNAGSNLKNNSNSNILIGNGVEAPFLSNNTANNQLNIGNWIKGNNGIIGIGNTARLPDAINSSNQFRLFVRDGISINSGQQNISGLRLTSLTSASPSVSDAKAIGVDAKGNVVTIESSAGNNSSSGWSLTGNSGTNPETHFIGTTDEKDLIFKTNSTERFRIGSNGRIHFGNTNANIYLGYGNNVSTSNSQSNIAIGNYSLSSNTTGSNNVAIGSNAGSVLRNNSNGNILIGNSVQAPFMSNNTASNQLNIGNWIIGNNGIIGVGSFHEALPTEIDSSNKFRLFVKNGIRTELVHVDIASANNWSDYVFEEDYKLMPLDDVERFIKNNKHLPNIPSAKQVVKDGINLAEMDAMLLEKIEELTLYIIEQEKEIQKYKLLEKRLETLEALLEEKLKIN